MSLLRWVTFAALGAAAFFLPEAVAREARKAHAELVLSAIDGHIVPRLERLHRATTALASDLESFCSDPGSSALRERVETSFKSAVTAWGAIDFVRFGPASETNRLDRFFFWPDPRAVTERQLRQLLARRDMGLLEPGALATRSVAVQGLGSLEIIVFDEMRTSGAAGGDAKYWCRYAVAIAVNLDAIAGDIETGWTRPHGWREKMLAPGSDNPLYKDASETARDVVKALLTGLQIAQDRHVVPRLEGALASPPKRVRLPFARSGMSAPYLEAELQSLGALFDVLGLAAYVPAGKDWMEAFIPRAFKTLVADAASLPQVDRAQPNDEKTIMRLRKMRVSLNGLRQIINRELAPAADLALGFNELDGD